uniref:Domain of unknown function DB domain-containing protein n=1 Tax=Meloidogyne enterolobii TaxID=390850 RepID=A0A6V7V9G2_MELEN|nr:unnamed protein product [Meloidogyne enterolobii]
MLLQLNIFLIFISTIFAQADDCGTAKTDWKPCIDRRIADMVFGSCCDRFVPPECRGICTYESHPIEARVLLMHTIQPSRCRLYKYLPAIVHCAAQTHDNTVCCKEMGLQEIGQSCLELCRSQRIMGTKSLRKDLVQCLSKWDQVMFCHQSGLRARKIKNAAAVLATYSTTLPTTITSNNILSIKRAVNNETNIK